MEETTTKRAGRAGARTPRRVAGLVLCLWSAWGLAQPTHVVAPGDTLHALARRYDTSVAELRRANELSGDLLRVGQTLRLPAPPGWRTVRAAEGDAWPDLAARTGVDVATLRAANPEVADPAGLELRVPPADGTIAWPRPGEDLVAFAARQGVAPGALAAANALAPPYGLRAGEPLLLPPGAADAPAAGVGGAAGREPSPGVPAAGPAPAAARAAPDPEGAPDGDPRAAHDALRDAALAGLAGLVEGRTLAPPDDGFDWPLAGRPRITSSFGWRNVSVGGNRYHLGLDLGAATGTPVAVARDGLVTRAGWTGAYGNAVYVVHDDGVETRYAHLSRIAVRVGERLRRGDEVGRVGSTGASTGPHLHFEARVGGHALDPLDLLPPY